MCIYAFRRLQVTSASGKKTISDMEFATTLAYEEDDAGEIACPLEHLPALTGNHFPRMPAAQSGIDYVALTPCPTLPAPGFYLSSFGSGAKSVTFDVVHVYGSLRFDDDTWHEEMLFPALERVDGDLRLDAHGLKEVSTFDKLERIGGKLVLGPDLQVRSVTFLSDSVRYVGGIDVQRVGSLESIDGLKGLTSVGGSIVIAGNPRLASASFLETVRGSASATVRNNPRLCASAYFWGEIAAAAEVQGNSQASECRATGQVGPAPAPTFSGITATTAIVHFAPPDAGGDRPPLRRITVEVKRTGNVAYWSPEGVAPAAGTVKLTGLRPDSETPVRVAGYGFAAR